MAPRTPTKRGPRTARIAVLLAANAAAVLFFWHLLAERNAAHTATAPAAVAAAAPVAPVEPDLPRRARDAELEARIRTCIASAVHTAGTSTNGRASASECAVSVHVRELGTTGELVAIEADRPMRPASNLKLVTSAAALVLLGPDGTFETVFESAAPIADGVLQGDLVVHAGGDPLYERDAKGDVSRLLAPVAAALKAKGIARIAGAIVLDEGTFQDPAPGPAWPAENQHWQEFCALAGGFSANAGCLTAVVTATQPGRAADVEVRPRGHGLPTRIDVRTGERKSGLDVRVGTAGGTVRVEGSIPRDVPAYEARFAAPDPVQLFAGALNDALAHAGIRADGGMKRERRTLAPGARVLARLTTPIVDVLVPINTYSNNDCADQLFLMTGKAQMGQGTRAGGRAATALALTKLGIDTQALVQVDGSGLSRDDRITARMISGLLDAVLRRDARSAHAFRDSLAVGGETGTLDKRMAALEGRVHAKTGFIGGTSALSGLIDASGGRTLIFSILVEYPNIEGLNTSCWKPMEDAICEALAGASG
jgi:serine-type D-Ala-D-Ala carboxypeptidase/endopeptidase (penicillin-binding protein 4)